MCHIFISQLKTLLFLNRMLKHIKLYKSRRCSVFVMHVYGKLLKMDCLKIFKKYKSGRCNVSNVSITSLFFTVPPYICNKQETDKRFFFFKLNQIYGTLLKFVSPFKFCLKPAKLHADLQVQCVHLKRNLLIKFQ